jgi:GLPGLI family protein
MAMMMGGDGITYKDLLSQEMIKQTEFYGKMFLIVDSLKKYEWKLGKETKMIGSYTCYKATTTQEVIMRKFGPPRGDNDRRIDTIQAEIVAWYSPQIPLSFGPSDYWGLPGLIMEVNTPNLKFLCTRIELKPNEDKAIEQPKKGEMVSQEEYNDIVQKKMEEMKKMYGGEHRGKGRY